jgi:hypothetical protein
MFSIRPNVTYISSDSAGRPTTLICAVNTNTDPIKPPETLAGVKTTGVAMWEYEREDSVGTPTAT